MLRQVIVLVISLIAIGACSGAIMLGFIKLGIKPVGTGGYVILWLLSLVAIPGLIIAVGGFLLITGMTFKGLTQGKPSLLWKVVALVIAILLGLLWLLPSSDYLEPYGSPHGVF